MRKDLLSFLIACFVALSVFCIYKTAHTGLGDGVAYAAFDPGMGNDNIKSRYSSAAQRDLRRSIAYNPDSILELTGQDVRAVLKEPGLIRRDAPTIIWQYRSEACVLDLYFTTDAKDAATAKVAYYEVRGREQDEDIAASISKACVNDIVHASNSPRMVGAAAFYKSQ